MLRSLNTAATGMDAQQTRLDVTSNNIANVATPGFKKSRAEFEELMVQVMRTPGGASSEGSKTPTGTQVGLGVRINGTGQMHSQGDLKQTGNPLDIAIEGRGYFQVRLANGEMGYTRAGALRVDAEGRMVTSEGHPLGSEISIPPDAQNVTIGADGAVTAMVPGEATPVDAGRIDLASFANPAGLVAFGHNLFKESVGSGTALLGAPGENGTGALSQGMLEMSNVKIVEEMIDLISGQRAYEVNAKVIRAGDEMLQQAANLR